MSTADDNEAVDKSDFSQQADDSHEYSGEFIDTEEDACGTWMKCEDESVKQYISKLSELPGCPCYYPVNIKSNNRVWDRKKGNFYNWVDASGPIEKLNIYKPGAFYCIRSLLIPGYDVLAAQQCCYDKYMRLTTRGRDAGTPNLISPQLSVELHKKVDILPWVICKGDWTRYNQVLSPNNVHDCRQNPDRREYLRQIKEAQNY